MDFASARQYKNDALTIKKDDLLENWLQIEKEVIQANGDTAKLAIMDEGMKQSMAGKPLQTIENLYCPVCDKPHSALGRTDLHRSGQISNAIDVC